MGVKSGLDPAVMIDVINAGSGMNTASRDKFPRSILPRSFDFGFATGLMVKDVRLCLEEAKALGMSMEVAEAVGRLWEVVIREMGAESDFTSAIKPIEKAAGVVVGGQGSQRAGQVKPVVTARCEATAHTSTSMRDGSLRGDPTTALTATAPACPSRSAHRPRCAGRTTAYWSSLTSTSGTSARVL